MVNGKGIYTLARKHTATGPRKGSHLAAVRALTNCDARTREGATALSLRAGLIADIGSDASTAKLALADIASFAALMVTRLAEPIALNRPLPDDAGPELRAWTRELRQTLALLGLERVKAEPRSLNQILDELDAAEPLVARPPAEPASGVGRTKAGSPRSPPRKATRRPAPVPAAANGTHS